MAKFKIAVVTDIFYNKNLLFNEFDINSNRDDCLRPWIELKKSLNNKNVDINTVDICPISEANIVFFLNVPNENDSFYIESINQNKIMFCIITELGFIHKNNLRLDLINSFNKVFTYQSDIVNNLNIFKLNYSFDFYRRLKTFPNIPFQERKLFSNLIAGNKVLNHINELYSTRVQIINWFKENYPSQLDLFGRGWNQKIVAGKFRIDYKYLGYFNFFIPDYYGAYKGEIDKKDSVLKKYKFSFTLENAVNVPGWITEKIFDSLFNGCIPIYLGASEITNFVDPSCFIDYRNFNSIEQLYHYISTLDESRFQEYQTAIFDYLRRKASEKDFEFGVPYFVNTLENQIFNSIIHDK